MYTLFQVNSTSTSIDVNKDGVRESMVTLSKGSRVVESFFVNESDIEATSGRFSIIYSHCFSLLFNYIRMH